MKLQLKNTLRKISKTFGRFLSIFLIVTLGVGFFAGIRATNDDMLHTGDRYYDTYHLMDFRITSTMGLTEKDLQEVLKVEGVEKASLGHTFDFLKDNNVLRVHTLLKDVNQVSLKSGRYPERVGECLAEEGVYAIGDTIILSGNNVHETMETNRFEVVGTIQSPMYISFDKGITMIGNGSLHSYLYVLEENITVDYYTDIYLLMKDGLALDSYSDVYEERVGQLRDNLEHLAPLMEARRYEELVKELTLELAKHEETFEKEKNKGEQELKKVSKELSTAKDKITSGYQKISRQEELLNQQKQNTEKQFLIYEKQLEEGYASYQKAWNAYYDNKETVEKELAKQKQLLEDKEQELIVLGQTIDSLKQTDPSNAQLPAMEQAYQEGLSQLSIAKQQFSLKEQEFLKTPLVLAATKDQLDATKKEIEKNKKAFQNEISTALKQIQSAKTTLQENEKKYEQGLIEYQKNLKLFEEEITVAAKELQDAKEQIASLEKPEWYLFDRTDNTGYRDFKDDASRVNNIAKVFPIFFLLVAALVALNTMTRLIEEERTQIGIFKALGFSNLMICMNYILYSFTATFFGCIIGLIAGNYMLPNAIFSVYSFTYNMPALVIKIDYPTFFVITLCAVFLMIGITVYSCQKILKLEPAELMRPPAPKEGKKILLERIPFLWNHLSFSMKVTFRNVFRYKKRIYMTVVGIAGCTALMLTGFGLRDGVGNIVKNQYQRIFTYDVTVFLDEGVKELAPSLIAKLSKNGIAKPMLTNQTLGNASAKEERNYEAYLVTLKEDYDYSEYFRFYDVHSHQQISSTGEGAIITAKLAELLNLKVGDYLYFKDNANHNYAIKIQAIMENYIFHYIFLKESYYHKLTGEEVSYNTLYGKLTENNYDTIANELMQEDAIVNVSFTHDLIERFDKIIHGLNNIVAVILLSACLLAIVVLYNLATINITERIREIASLKVLGFYNKEVSSYIFREIYILTFLGIVVGLFLGIYLHRFVMITAEMDMIMFEKEIQWISYVLAAFLSVLFSFVVNLIINHKLKKIDMIESLKSVE